MGDRFICRFDASNAPLDAVQIDVVSLSHFAVGILCSFNGAGCLLELIDKTRKNVLLSGTGKRFGNRSLIRRADLIPNVGDILQDIIGRTEFAIVHKLDAGAGERADGFFIVGDNHCFAKFVKLRLCITNTRSDRTKTGAGFRDVLYRSIGSRKQTHRFLDGVSG